MTVLFYAVALLLALGTLVAIFLKADPRRLADGFRVAGPVAVGAVGSLLLLTGRAGLGGTLISLALGWYVANRSKGAASRGQGRRSTVRSAALEMDLDHETGALEGLVLAGRFEGRKLSQLEMDDLLQLSDDLVGDPESIQLLETYLDGRFSDWREGAQADSGRRKGRAPASGAMSKQEAYQILGLEAGAGAAEIRKAHRRLMQRVHPDLGGTSFLAARINEAKDILLSGHE